MKFLFLIKYWILLKIFDCYKDKSIGNKTYELHKMRQMWYYFKLHTEEST